MTLNSLQNNQEVLFRTGRAGESRPGWGQWFRGKLYVVRRPNDFKQYKKGEIVTLAIQGAAWAEYGERDYCGEGVFAAEDFYLEIKGLQ